MKRPLRTLLAVPVLSAALLTVLPAGASWASTGEPGSITTCPPDPWYVVSGVSTSHRSAVPTAYGDPGGTITITITIGAAATAAVSISGTASVSGILLAGSVTTGVTLSATLTASTAYSYSWLVPRGVNYGYVGAGAYSKHYSWSHWQYVGCVGKKIGSGTANGPYRFPAFWHGTG